jgi:hypothetical protein
MSQRVRALTLSEIAQWCAISGADPTTTVGELLGHEGADVAGLLVPTRTQRGEDALEVA